MLPAGLQGSVVRSRLLFCSAKTSATTMALATRQRCVVDGCRRSCPEVRFISIFGNAQGHLHPSPLFSPAAGTRDAGRQRGKPRDFGDACQRDARSPSRSNEMPGNGNAKQSHDLASKTSNNGTRSMCARDFRETTRESRRGRIASLLDQREEKREEKRKKRDLSVTVTTAGQSTSTELRYRVRWNK